MTFNYQIECGLALSVLSSITIRVIAVVKICCGLTRLRRVSPQNFEHCDEAYWLSIRVQTMLNHFLFAFYHNISIKENVSFSERELKKTWRGTLTQAASCGLLSTSK